jgi:hypothetical protein
MWSTATPSRRSSYSLARRTAYGARRTYAAIALGSGIDHKVGGGPPLMADAGACVMPVKARGQRVLRDA